MNVARGLSSLRGLLSIFLLVCGQRGVAQAVPGTVQLQGTVVSVQGNIIGVTIDADSQTFPNKLFKVYVDRNTKVTEVGGKDRYVKPISASDFKNGDHVMLKGFVAQSLAPEIDASSVTRMANDGDKVAGAVSASPSLVRDGKVAQNASPTVPPAPASPQGPDRSRVTMLVGKVQSVSGTAIVLKTNDNNNVTTRNQFIQIVVDSQAKVDESAYREGEYRADTIKPIPATSIAIGDDLTVYGRFDVAGANFLASGVGRKVMLPSPTSQLAAVKDNAQNACPTVPPQSESAQKQARRRATYLTGVVRVISGNTICLQTTTDTYNTIKVVIQANGKVEQHDPSRNSDYAKPVSLTAIATGEKITAYGIFDMAGSTFLSDRLRREIKEEVRDCSRPAGKFSNIDLEADAQKACFVSLSFVKCDDDYYSLDIYGGALTGRLFNIADHYLEYKDFRVALQKVAVSPADHLNGIEWQGEIYIHSSVHREREYDGKWGRWESWVDSPGAVHFTELVKQKGEWKTEPGPREPHFGPRISAGVCRDFLNKDEHHEEP